MSGKLAEMVRQRRGEEAPPKEATPKQEKAVQTVIGSDGTIERYDNRHAKVTDEMVKRAEELETQIIDNNRRVTANYLKMARDLLIFQEGELWLARGYDTFKEWAESPELAEVGYRTAYNLVRIAREVIPLLESNNLLDQIPSISNLYDLLPLLSDEDGQNKFLQGMKAVKGMSNRDAKAEIRRIRGIEEKVGERKPTMFRCRVKKTGDYYKVQITAGDGLDFYIVGNVQIKVKDYARWENLYGAENIELVDNI